MVFLRKYQRDMKHLLVRHLKKTIVKDPEKYFTKDVMKQLEDAAQSEFHYGSSK